MKKKASRKKAAPDAPRVSPELRERILQGAARAIGQLGYASARVEDILEASCVSRPTFYKVFESKEAVFKALSARHHAEVRERMHAASTHPEPKPRLLDGIETFLRWRAELGPIGRVLDQEARTPGTVIAHHRKRTLQDMLELTAQSVRRAGLPDVDPVLFLALIAALESVADQLLLEAPVAEATLQRAVRNALTIMGGAFAVGAPAPPVPAAPARKRAGRRRVPGVSELS